MRTLYITDLDGTLLNSNTQISAYTRDTINMLQEKGMLFTYATARSLTSAAQVTPGLKVSLPIISNNGTFIVDAQDGSIQYTNFFTHAMVQTIKDIFEKYNANPLVYAHHKEENIVLERISWELGRESEGLLYYINNRKEDKRMRPIQKDAIDCLYEGEVFYFTCIGDKQELAPVYDALKSIEDITCIFHQELYREEYWLEVMTQKASKANAMLQLKQWYDIDKVICFGDGENDLMMFQAADEGYAMENAVQALKEIASGVIGNNDEDAVAKWLLANWKA